MIGHSLSSLTFLQKNFHRLFNRQIVFELKKNNVSILSLIMSHHLPPLPTQTTPTSQEK